MADWVGNMLFFCPLVIAFNWGWWSHPEIIWHYLLASVPIAAVGGRGFSLFLKHIWYPRLGLKF